MILLWGVPGDRPLAAVMAALRKPYFLIDQYASIETTLDLCVAGEIRGRVRTPAGVLALESVAAAYIRPHDSARIAGTEEAHLRCLDDALLSWCEMTPARVVNRPCAMASNGSKPYQSMLISASGFALPETLITTSAAELERFAGLHGELIYKSISGVRSIVNRLTSEHRARMSDLANCPTQFQRWIDGVDHRVHVVGDEVFACEILSASADYRYPSPTDDGPEILACALPPAIEDRCRDLARGLGLLVAGIDLRRTPDGEWYCFEVNPSPGFTYYQQATNQPIAGAIARLLAS